MTIQSKLLEFATRPEGAKTGDMLALGFDRTTISRAAYYLMKSGKIFGFMCAGGAAYFHTPEACELAKAAWEAGKAERAREKEREKYAKRRNDPEWVQKRNQQVAEYRRTKRAADREAGILPPMTRKPPKPRQYNVTQKQKPSVAATVHIKAYARGPAYLPGEPLITSKTKFTFGVSPMNPSRTNTHAE